MRSKAKSASGGKIFFKVLGALIILAIGASLCFYGRAGYYFSQAEKFYNHGVFDKAELFYEKGISGLKKLQIFKTPILKSEIETARLNLAWTVYWHAYYEPEKYELTERIVSQELSKKKSGNKDQFYNLKALICWQKGVELFIKLGKKAAALKELDQLLEEAKINSGEAVANTLSDDSDIKYNYEFFRQSKEKLKQNMQQQAQQKKQNREKKKQGDQISKEKNVKPNQQQDQTVEDKNQKDKDKANILVPADKDKPQKAEESSYGTTVQKKKKKG